MGAQQQQINYGAAVNDGQGDPLRTAFIKTDDNFDAIWAAGPVGSNIVISNNNITATNTNGDLRLGTNGTGNIRALRHVIPTGNRLYDLGAANLRFGTVYANSLDVVNFGISTLSVNVIQSDDSAFVLVNDGLEVNGNIAANSIFTTSIQSSDSSMVTINDGLDVNGNVSAAYFVGDGSQLTNLPTVSTYSNANVTAFLGSGLNTSIIPAANATYSLGDASHYWSNLWVAANTIYIGGVALGVSGNVLTVAGEPVLSNDSATDITTTGNIAAQEITATGDFTGGNVEIRTAQLRLAPAASQSTLSLRPDGGIGVVGINLPNNATANTVDLTVENNSGNVRIKSAGLDGWLFGADNVLTAPGNITANYFLGNGSQLTGVASTGNITFADTTISPPDGEDITISAANSQVDIQALDFRVVTTDDVRITGNDVVSLRNLSTTEPISIITDYDNTQKTWEFGVDGTLTAPGDITVAGDVAGTSGASTLVLRAQPASNTLVQLNNSVDSGISTVANLGIRTDVDGTTKQWLFDTNGDLTVPNYVTFAGATFIGDEPGAGTPYFRIDTPLGYPATITTDSGIAGNNWSWQFGADGVLTAPGNITTTGNISATGNVSATRLQNDGNLEIRSDVAGTARTWTFDTLGDLNLPVGGNISGSGGISANNITLTGNISGNTAGYAIGYRDIPQVSFTGNATMAATDAGKHFYSTESTNYTLTIADNSAVSWPVGTAITVVNRGTGNITVAQASGVSLYLAGNSTAGNRTVTTYGMVTLLNVAANVWMINGTGVA